MASGYASIAAQGVEARRWMVLDAGAPLVALLKEGKDEAAMALGCLAANSRECTARIF